MLPPVHERSQILGRRRAGFLAMYIFAGCKESPASVTPPTPPAIAEAPADAAPPSPWHEPDASPPALTATDAGVPPGAGEGQMCGGLLGKRCRPGLRCVMVGPMHPDKSGTCRAAD
jgi:hypothetical protein